MVKHMIYRREKGQALIEFLLVVTLLVTLLLGVVDFSLAYYTQVAVKNAVAEAGYYANQHPRDDDGIRASIRQQLANLTDVADSGIDQDSNIVIDRTCDDGAEQTTIRMTYQHQLLFNWLISSGEVTLGAQTVVPQLGGC
jgi:Flp pilus assembly protein TadG